MTTLNARQRPHRSENGIASPRHSTCSSELLHPQKADWSLWRRLTAAAILATVTIVAGCQTTAPASTGKYTVDGVQYGVSRGVFRARWWNYYHRGLSFAEGGFLKEAEADLRQAIAMRSEDARQARTYGMHFVQYFGNRELGVVLHRLGRSDDALPYLEASLEQTATDKAAYYLRRARTAAYAGRPDTSAPTVEMASRIVSNRANILLRGSATDNLAVAAVTVDGASCRQTRDGKFELELELTPGERQVQVIAQDYAGNRTTAECTLIYDPDPPIVSIVDASSDAVVVQVTDATTVTIPEADGAVALGNGRFRIPIANNAIVHFRDEAGNVNTVSLPQFAELAACGESDRLVMQQLCLAEGVPLAAKGPLSLDRYVAGTTVSQSDFYLAGEVRGDFQSLMVNDRIIVQSGRNTRFCIRQPLTLGENELRLSVTDADGKQQRITTNVTRTASPISTISMRATLLACPIADDSIHPKIGPEELFSLRQQVFASNRFRLVERDDLEVIAREHRLIEDGWIRADTAARVGKLLQAEYVLACSARETDVDIEIYGRIIDAETSQVLAECDVYCRKDGRNPPDVYALFAGKLQQEFPVIEREIIWVGGKPMIQAGENAFVKEGMRFSAVAFEAAIRDAGGSMLARGVCKEIGELSATRIRSGSVTLSGGKDIPRGEGAYAVSR